MCLEGWGRVSHPAQRHLWAQKRRAQLPIDAQCLVLSHAFLWFLLEEWTSKVALGAGLLAQPPESPLNWHPASLNPELLHPGMSNGRD